MRGEAADRRERHANTTEPSGKSGIRARSRLRCQVLPIGRAVAECRVLLAARANAQGRLAPGTADSSGTAATRLACDETLRGLLGNSG
jgi:hypothetical protein